MLAGINVKRMRMTAYVLSAFFAAIGGILLTLDVGIGLPETGDGWEFRAIAGCVVGGVSLSGGKGSPLGILIGVTLVFVAENAIIFLGMPSTMRVAIQGALMAGAVLFDIFRQSRDRGDARLGQISEKALGLSDTKAREGCSPARSDCQKT